MANSNLVTIDIDGQELKVEAGTMVIQAADAAGIYIPHFCYHKKLSVAANCRMCLVEVEKAPKPLPACATPVMDGMVVRTHSEFAVTAQKGTMEFLLINHPLDCPICDQGGECPLQDQAVGYGKDVSRFSEKKRVVANQDIGPLISTEMTRCIHCTRCVRFGQEVAGIMELGATGRGEHMEIGTFIGKSVDSELSGNVIDLCPVGALTSKPYRFSARSWELINHDGVSPHDSVGTNIVVQSLRNRVMRVLPRENEKINECWISDRDRFSYQALNSEDRLLSPMIRRKGEWQQVDWKTALEFAVEGIRRQINKHGAESFGVLASPLSTLEEFYLLQQLTRGLGSGNVDHRLRQTDFSGDEATPLYPGLGQRIEDLEKLDAALIIGSNIRKEQPLIGLRLRKASLHGAKVMALNPLDYKFNFELANKEIVAPSMMPASLATIILEAAKLAGETISSKVDAWAKRRKASKQEIEIAKTLHESGNKAAILLGSLSIGHPSYSIIRALSEQLAELTGAQIGILPEANGAGGWVAGCLPHRDANAETASVSGYSVQEMLSNKLRCFLLFGMEPELDCIDGRSALTAMQDADFVVNIVQFKTEAQDYADVLLPLAAFTESSGTYVNCEGVAQSFTAAVPAQGEARPGWKILRVLGNLFELSGFDYVSSEEVKDQISLDDLPVKQQLKQLRIVAPNGSDTVSEIDIERIVDIPIYAGDSLVRRSGSLQQTSDNPAPSARMNQKQIDETELSIGDKVSVHFDGAIIELGLIADPRVPENCVYIPGGYAATALLGASGFVKVVKA